MERKSAFENAEDKTSNTRDEGENQSTSSEEDAATELPVTEQRHRHRSSLPVSIDAVPRLFRRSRTFSDNDRASVITISRTPSAARDAFPDRGASFAAQPRRSQEDDAMECGDLSPARASCERLESSGSDPEEPLLANAHRVNHEHAPDEPETSTSLTRRISIAMNVSLAANVLLLAVKIYAYWASKSKAILASAADSLVDIASQLVIAYAEYKVHKADPRFPIGRTRMETVGVVACAVIMTLSTLEVVQTSVLDLWDGFHGDPPEIDMGIMMYAILGAATGIKVLLYIYCFALRKTSDSMMALAEDHGNDILSNLMAIVCGVIGSLVARAWWVDPAGAILISAYIIWSWGMICMNQVDKIIGKGAPEDFIEKLEDLANSHHDDLEVDVIRAYFFGSRFVVEMEVVMPAAMSVRESHDIALVLQHKVESFDEVERAFVHVDYEKRKEPEHKVERNLLRNSDNLFESHDSLKSRERSLNHQTSGKSMQHQSSGHDSSDDATSPLLAPRSSK